MRPLHGVSFVTERDLDGLKRSALLLDAIHSMSPRDVVHDERTLADRDFLQQEGFLLDTPEYEELSKVGNAESDGYEYQLNEGVRPGFLSTIRLHLQRDLDTAARRYAAEISSRTSIDTIPLFSLSDSIVVIRKVPNSSMSQTLEVAISAMPVPAEDSSWQDILDFKNEARNKLWGLRRFLHAAGTKKQTEAELRDDIEWCLNEYGNEMDHFKLKRTVSFMETYVIPTVEALEGFKPSSLLKGLVSIKKRKIELLEGEAKAAGRECAYVFDARKRFGPR